MVKYTIKGTEYTFEMINKEGTEVLQATYDKNGETFSIWTAEATAIPRYVIEAQGMLDEYNWE